MMPMAFASVTKSVRILRMRRSRHTVRQGRLGMDLFELLLSGLSIGGNRIAMRSAVHQSAPFLPTLSMFFSTSAASSSTMCRKIDSRPS